MDGRKKITGYGLQQGQLANALDFFGSKIRQLVVDRSRY